MLMHVLLTFGTTIHDKEWMLADGSKGRVSVKEKLAEMKQKISNQKMPEKLEVTKSKGKEESL